MQASIRPGMCNQLTASCRIRVTTGHFLNPVSQPRTLFLSPVTVPEPHPSSNNVILPNFFMELLVAVRPAGFRFTTQNRVLMGSRTPGWRTLDLRRNGWRRPVERACQRRGVDRSAAVSHRFTSEGVMLMTPVDPAHHRTQYWPHQEGGKIALQICIRVTAQLHLVCLSASGLINRFVLTNSPMKRSNDRRFRPLRTVMGDNDVRSPAFDQRIGCCAPISVDHGAVITAGCVCR